jgi:RimJ/RimL family protein N-acetyltransferase
MAMLPDVRIETKRLILRPFGVQDLGEVLAVMEAGDREALPPGAPADADEVGGWLEDAVHRLHRDGGGIHLAISEKETGAHVGGISLFRTDWEVGATEVGYGVRRERRSFGYATEALQALTEWVLTRSGIQRVELRANTDNLPSAWVAQKAGYTREGTLRRALREEDGLHDLAIYSRLSAL